MGTIAFLLSFVLGLIMIIGLIKPSKVLKFSERPTRGKAFLIFGVPAFGLFIIFGMLYESPLDVALQNPGSTTQLKLSTGYLEEVPPEVAQLINLEILDLNKNKITKLPEFLKDLKKLKVLDLGRNPISNIPAWVAGIPSLKELNLYQTQITRIPVGFEHLEVNYEGTPLWKEEHPEKPTEGVNETAEIAMDSDEKDHTESLGEFAMRKFLGKDYGYRRKFQKGEIFYNDPVTEEQADQVGEIMQTMGFFNDEKEVSMLLDKENEIFELKMVIDQSQELDDEVREGFSALRGLVQITAFPTDSLHLHLTDREFETLEIIKK